MKELEKTKQISIAATLFILAVLIGFLTYKRPKNTYAFNTKSTLEKITSTDYCLPYSLIENEDVAFIDIRNSFEYNKGHLENAINMPSVDIMSEASLKLLLDLKKSNTTTALYGSTPEEANIPFLILYQLGFDNLKILPVELSYSQNKLITKESKIENLPYDINGFIMDSKKHLDSSNTIVPPNANVPKKVITVEKKKKRKAEGGC
ncbi:rhodanese-like domain-containing protein [Aestuariibaculum lutulentum]|uniref:Rhodanese-like domain-containing protein n=1 Tax=Aestuariibaculum lutulentum TaxID=2920935 RepID=A0ABS9RH23_9FLAO|nr:rhodanese-like domain-containing protein [Aestuariibaculum lutulentum]MCH4552250.1 rhodanese-like domain-containing protein [Aestuariibaculum lutulentum]